MAGLTFPKGETMVTHFLVFQGMMARQLTFVILSFLGSSIITAFVFLSSLVMMHHGVSTEHIFVSLLFHIRFYRITQVKLNSFIYVKDKNGSPATFFRLGRIPVRINGMDEAAIREQTGNLPGDARIPMDLLAWPVITRKGIMLAAEAVCFRPEEAEFEDEEQTSNDL
jgi:hypothetical protein